MRLAIELARQNVLRGTGGPFGAAILTAQHRIGSYTLAGSPETSYELFSSCDPCAMCLGAVLWSGLRRMVTGADRDDATALSFEEGPVFPESYAYLEERGVTITRGVLRQEAAAVMELYRRQGGKIYNA